MLGWSEWVTSPGPVCGGGGGYCVCNFKCAFVWMWGGDTSEDVWGGSGACWRAAITQLTHQLDTHTYTKSRAGHCYVQACMHNTTHTSRKLHIAKSKYTRAHSHLSYGSHLLKQTQTNVTHCSFTLASFPLATTSHLCMGVHSWIHTNTHCTLGCCLHLSKTLDWRRLRKATEIHSVYCSSGQMIRNHRPQIDYLQYKHHLKLFRCLGLY